MKLSKSTLSVLKNFAGINPSIYLTRGNVLMTKSLDNVIYAEAQISDTIDSDVGIYDVSEFMSIHNLFTDPELTSNTEDLKIEIKDNRSSVSYSTVDPSIIKYPPKRATFPVADVIFELRDEDLERVTKAAGTMGLPEICITRVNDKIVIKALDTKEPDGMEYTLEVADYDGDNQFSYFINIENIHMEKGTYTVSAYKNIAVQFAGAITYIIAVKATSTFE